MNFFKRFSVACGTLIVGLFLAYKYVLNEEQRGLAREANEEIQAVMREVTDMVVPLVSEKPTRAQEEAKAEANRERTREQWEKIGY